MKQKALPRKERERLRQRQEILHASLTLFAEKGYHSVSMQEIAEKSEFSIGSIYKFFENKEDLYKAMILSYCDEFETLLLEVLRETPGDEMDKLRAYVSLKGKIFQKNLPFIRTFLAESKGAGFTMRAQLRAEMGQRYMTFLETLSEVFESGIRNKRFAPISAPYHLALILDNITDSFLILWLEKPGEHPYPENPDVILDVLTKGLIPSSFSKGI